MTNNEELINLIMEYQFSNEQIAEMSGYSVDSVKAWRSSPAANKHRTMPDRAMKLLKLVIKVQKLKRRA